MEFFSEKLTWLNILYNKMHCHKKITSSSVKWKVKKASYKNQLTDYYRRKWTGVKCPMVLLQVYIMTVSHAKNVGQF